jgi:outer membrane protein assembly factor BamB
MFLWSRGSVPSTPAWTFSGAAGNINGIAIGQAQGQPPIAYAASSDGNIYAILLLDGTAAWAAPYSIGKDITEMPAISRDGLFLFINVEGLGTFKVDSQTGLEVWAKPDVDILGSASFIVGQNGNLLGGDRLGQFFSFDALTGEQTWAAPYKADEAITSPAVVDGGGYVYFADRGGNVYCLDSVTGEEEWRLDTNTSDLAGMAIDNDHALYIVTGDGMFIQIVGVQPPIIIPRTRVPSQAQWAQRGGTPQHSGESTYNGPAVTDGSQLGIAWDFKTQGEIVVGAVAAGDGTIIIPDDMGNVYGLASSTGKQKWMFHIDTGFVAGEPAIDVGSTKVFIGTSTGLLVALDVDTGTELWHANLDASILGSVTVTADSRVYVSCEDNNVYGFDGQTGTQTFKVSTGSFEDDFAPAVLYDDSTILVGSEDGFVRAYNSFTQGLRWRYQTHGAVLDVPCVAQTTGDIFIGAANELIAIDGNSGDRLWEQSNVNIAGSSPGCGNKHNLVYVGGTDNTLYAVEQATGTERWSFLTQDAIRSNPVLDQQQETLYVTGMDGYLYALDAATGNLNWKIFVALFLRGDPVIMLDHSIVVTSENSDMIYKIAVPQPAPPAPSSSNDAGVIVAVLLVVGVVGYAGGGIGYSYVRTGEVRHVHGQFWSGVGASIGGWCQSSAQGMLRRPVPTGYSSSSAPIASSSSSSFQKPSASSGFPAVGAATAPQPSVGSGGGYGSL